MMHTTLCVSPTGAFQNFMPGGMDTNRKLMLLAEPPVMKFFVSDSPARSPHPWGFAKATHGNADVAGTVFMNNNRHSFQLYVAITSAIPGVFGALG